MELLIKNIAQEKESTDSAEGVFVERLSEIIFEQLFNTPKQLSEQRSSASPLE